MNSHVSLIITTWDSYGNITGGDVTHRMHATLHGGLQAYGIRHVTSHALCSLSLSLLLLCEVLTTQEGICRGLCVQH